MKCAITGSSGVLGSNFIKKNNNIDFIKFEGDLSKKNQIIKWINKNEFDFFLHFGAIVPTGKVEKNYKTAKSINLDSIKVIINELKKKKKKIWFFFPSSSHIYSFSNKKLNEKSKKIPISKYGKLKLLAERLIKKSLRKTQINYCIGRIFSFTHFKQKKSYVIPSIFLGKANVTSTFRDFIDVRDICDCICFLMKRKTNGFYNIASGRKTNLMKIDSIINNKKIKYIKKSKNNLFADISKIKNLGWKPKYNINDIIKEYKKKIKN